MKGYRHLTAEQKQAILETYSQCLDATETAARVGVARHRVWHLLNRHGIRPSRASGGACYRRIDEVRAWSAQGVSLSEMARRLGTNPHRVAEFLEKHQIPRTPFLQVGANNPAWKGGRTTDKNGYILVCQPDHPAADSHGYVREHRLVMEAILGRPLTATEVVHHKDDNPSNNDPDNLELFDSNADHLAATLKGKIPNWTPAGKEAIRVSVRRPRGRQRTATPPASSPGDPSSPQTTGQTPASGDTGTPPLSERAPQPAQPPPA